MEFTIGKVAVLTFQESMNYVHNPLKQVNTPYLIAISMF